MSAIGPWQTILSGRRTLVLQAAPDAIATGRDFIARAFQKAAQSIPIVVMTEDMVAGGFVASLARPGGNITGISLMSPDLDGKRQDILIEAVPTARRIAVLADPTQSGHWRTSNCGNEARIKNCRSSLALQTQDIVDYVI
jgi:ABC-type uncharacterized transport system substrate-binding protein